MHYFYDGGKQLVRELESPVLSGYYDQQAIGCSVNGGYVYRSDFIGALNQNDMRQAGGSAELQ